MKKREWGTFLFSLGLALCLMVFMENGHGILRLVSDALFFVGMIYIGVGLYVHLLNYGYFKGLWYGFYYVAESFRIQWYERKNVGYAHEKRRVKDFYDYVHGAIKQRRNGLFFIIGGIYLIVSFGLAFYA